MQKIQATAERGARDTDGIRDILDAIHDQGQLTLELVRMIAGLLMPKEGGREGPSLEELLAALLVQQRETITIVKATQGDLDRLGKTLPAAVADEIDDQAVFRRVRPS